MFQPTSSVYILCNHLETNVLFKSPLLSACDRSILDITKRLNDTRLGTFNKLLKESFPAVGGLQNPVL